VSEDYAQTGWQFKVKKVVRYVRLYGLFRTYAKIKGQFHMNATEAFKETKWINKACANPLAPERSVALIGCGNYAFSNIAYYLSRFDSNFLRVTYDVQLNRSLSLCKEYRGAFAVADWHEILFDPHVKTVFIASNHATHAEYAIACINAGKNVHIEKPHVVSQEQLEDLLTAMKQHPEVKVFLGFNRPRSPLFIKLQEYLAKESGPLMINWFVAGHEIVDSHWYFDEKEGGRVLGNLSHWTDVTLHLVSLQKAFPCTIIPATSIGSKSDFMVSILFADGSCAAVTFSAKGQTFEGVREVLNLQKGNVLANITDFSSLTIDIGAEKIIVNPFLRDHGHLANIEHSMQSAINNSLTGESVEYVAATAKFFLAIKQAIDSGVPVVLNL
jgi:predicted dehydrogenase